MKGASIAVYQSYVVEQGLERLGLFQAIRQKYGGTAVLYPGCFVHVTPSFYYPHVVYVDRMAEAARFFSSVADIAGYVSQRKQYKRTPYIHFIQQDYTQPLPLPDGSFDLLVALFAGGITRACKRYLRPGGLVLTNNHHDDAGQAAVDSDLTLVAALHRKGVDYQVVETGLEEYFVCKVLPAGSDRYLQPTGRPMDYTRTADAYIFRKHGAR